jgi:hypothetical protein
LRRAIEVGVIVRLRYTSGARRASAQVDHGGAVETDGVALGGGGAALLEPDVVEAGKGYLLALGSIEEVLDDPIGVGAAEGRAAVEDDVEGVGLVEVRD